jgi:Uncharacterised nucleotidyltransferase
MTAPKVLHAIFQRAWPSPSIDLLLRAALLADDGEAANAWRAFESSADLDHPTAGEMRLLGLVASRLAILAPNSPIRPTVIGVERQNWTRSQVVIGEAASALQALSAASIGTLVIKGGGYAARGGAAARWRVVNDLDIAVSPDLIEAAYDILISDGWVPSGSGSALYQRENLRNAVGTNLVRGKFGNIDLHRTAFHEPYLSIADDPAIWERSVPGQLAGVTVRAPCPTDMIVIGLAHGALDAHKHSDWLADLALAIDLGEIDWALFESIVERRGLQGAAASGLSYVAERLQRPLPESLIARLESHAIRAPLALAAKLAETAPKTDRIGLSWMMRLVAKQSRLWRARRKKAYDFPTYRPSWLPGRKRKDAGVSALQHELSLPDREPQKAWSGLFDLTVRVELPAVKRRVEFEINSEDRHLARLRARVINRGRRTRAFRFKFAISLQAEESGIILTAAPARVFNNDVPAQLLERYDALPFRLVDVQIASLPSHK